VAVIAFPCCLAQFVISNNNVMRILASCKTKWGFERQYDIFRWKRGPTTRKRGTPDGKCCVEKRSAPKMLEENRMKMKCAKSRLQIADGDWTTPKVWGGSGVLNEIEGCQSRQKSTNVDWGVLSQQRNACGNRGAPIRGKGAWKQIEEHQLRQKG